MSLLTGFLAVVGGLFVLIAGIGILRFGDLYTRMHAASKAGAFGGTLIALSAAVEFRSLAVWVKAILIVLFFYLTTPIAAQMLARAGCLIGTRPTSDTGTKELEPHLQRLKQESSASEPPVR